jgi:NADH dehydrogenase FAD-containing subunit
MLETPRLTLRPFKITDYQAVYEFGSNKEVQKLIGDKLIGSPKETRKKSSYLYVILKKID